MSNIAIIIISLVLSAFFSGMEIAYVTSNKLQIELDRKKGKFSTRLVSLFIDPPSRYLTTMLVGNNIALVVYGLIMARILDPIIGLYLNNEIAVLAIQTIISTVFILVAAEFLPKVIFRSIPNQSLNWFSVPILIFYLIFYPVTYFITTLTSFILNRFNRDDKNPENKNVFNKVDLLYFIKRGQSKEENQSEDINEIKLFKNALDFSSVKVRDCMVPRTEIVACELDTPDEDIKKLIIETGYSKILIYEETIDNIIGYITSKSLFAKTGQPLNIIEISYVPETMSANKLLKKLIHDKKSLAVVVDEFGGVSGMLSIEDIIEEIFGEIEDEHDTLELIEKKISDNEFILSGRLEIDHLNEIHHLNLEKSEDYETLAGFIIHHYESIPKMDERIIIDGFEIKILKVSKTKIELIHLKKNN